MVLQAESLENDSSIVQRFCVSSLTESFFDSLSIPGPGSTSYTRDFDPRAVSAAECHPSPDVNSELTVPSSPRNQTNHHLNHPPWVRHHVRLSDSPSSPFQNPLDHNGFPSTTSPHVVLNPSPSIPPQTTFVSDSIPHHGPPPHHTTLVSPSTNAQYLSHQLPNILDNPDLHSPLDFDLIRSEYLTMITTKPSDATKAEAQRSSAPDTFCPLTPPLDKDIAVQDVMDALEGSPDYKMRNDFGAYLTSPLDDSPWEDMLTTPSFGFSGDLGVDILTSPILLDSGDDFGDMPLFPDAPTFNLTFEKLNTDVSNKMSSSEDHISTLSFPDDHSVGASSHSRSGSAAPIRSRRKGAQKVVPTGTRKNVSPESLIPAEAPIQPRKYVTSSATSRKKLPVIFARKRKHSIAFGAEEEEDQLDADTPSIPPTLNELDAIEAKRRQNTLAARRSRKRKLEHQREVESALEDARAEKDVWKVRALALGSLLRDKGIKIPVELENGLNQN